MSPDPYDVGPTFWERNAAFIAPLVAGILTAGLTVASFPPYHAPEFAYVCLVPGIFWAYLRPSFRFYAWTMGAAQAVAWTIILGWLHHVTWVGLALLGPVIGVWTGLWYLAVWWAIPRMAGRPTPIRLVTVLGLAGTWVVIEWTRTWFLGGFDWLPLAASQWERTSILQVAAYTGAGGISFVLVAMNVGFAAYGHRLLREGATGLRRRSQEFLLALFLLLACLSIHVQETFNRLRFTVPFARVAFVQPDIPQEVKWDPAKAPRIVGVLQAETLAAASTNPDLILWPEAVTPLPVRDDLSVRRFVEGLAARVRAPLLVGSVAVERGRPAVGGTAASGGASAAGGAAVEAEDRWYNAAFVVTPDFGLQHAMYAKRKLVQFGEYVPLRPLLGWLGKFVPIGDDFSRGTDASPLLIPLRQGSAAFGLLICYEDTYPALARSTVLSGADVLAVLTNNGWFGEGGAAYQHAAHSVLRAVETRRPVLRCGNAGWSGWIDEFGNVRKVLVNAEGTIYFRGTGTANVTRDIRWVGKNSFYVEHGDWFVATSAVLAALAAMLLGMGGLPPVVLDSDIEAD